MTILTVIKYSDQLFTLYSTARITWNIFTKSSIYHPSEDGQAEKTVQTIWKTVQLD